MSGTGKEQSGHRGPGNVDQVIETVREFGEYLGDEVAVSFPWIDKGEPSSPTRPGRVEKLSGFPPVSRTADCEIRGQSTGTAEHPFVDDPLTATAATPEVGKRNDTLYVWIREDLFAASPKLDQLQALSGVMQKGNTIPFAETAFHGRIAKSTKRVPVS